MNSFQELNSDMIAYYRERAKEYEEVYYKPERQENLQQIAEVLQSFFAGKSLYEIACGTGYWTERISETAKSIIASDINEAVLEVAKSKSYPNNNVRFINEDLFSFNPERKLDNLFGGFIWSHIKHQELDIFLTKVNSLVKKGGSVVFTDNNYVEGSNTPISHTDEFGNTYQTRKLSDGTSHLVLKNFPKEEFIRNKIKPFGKVTDFINLKYYWVLFYSV